jgi:hypothetical protein
MHNRAGLALCSQVFCKNDNAFLCGDCNTAAHNNPLAARHTIVSAAEAMESATAASVPDSSSNTTEKPHQQQQVPAVPAGKLDKEALTKTVFGKDLEVSSRLRLAAGKTACDVLHSEQQLRDWHRASR